MDEPVEAVRYSTIGINAWTGVGYLTPRASWGAFPGHEPHDIQSGRRVVHNALLLDGRSERSSEARSDQRRARSCTAS